MTAALFDTNILIDFLHGAPAAQSEIARVPDRAISTITWIEVMVGAIPKNIEATRAFLHTFRQLPVTPEVAERAVTLRQQQRIKLPDAIILATAQVHGRLLITRNTRDFPAGTPGVHAPYTL